MCTGRLNRGWRRSLRSFRAWQFLLFVSLALLYLTFRSASPDDFDSYSFILALRHFDLGLQQPHPPGFPVYVAAGRLFTGLCGDPTRGLTTLSALSGTLSMVFIAQIGWALIPRRRAWGLMAALLYALLPVSWLTAEKALSDAPGMMAMLWALSAWLRWSRWEGPPRPRPPIVPAFLSGLSLGVRPQNAAPLALLVVTLIVRDVRQHRPLGNWLTAFAAGVLGVAVWLVPTAHAAGGLAAYGDQLLGHAAHVGRADSLLGMSGSLTTVLRGRSLAFVDDLLLAVVGVSLQDALPWYVVARVGVLTVVIGWGCLKGLATGLRQRSLRWVVAWFILLGLQILLFETLDRPRLLLPWLASLVLLTASGWEQIRAASGLRTGGIALLGLLLLTQTTPWAALLAREPAPPEQAVRYIAAHYPPGATVVAAAGSFRAAQVSLSEYPLLYLYQLDPEMTHALLQEGYRYVAILDRDQATPEAMALLSQQDAWVTVDDRTFVRDRHVHTQHDQVRLQVLASPEWVPAEALALPADGCIDLGGEDDGRYLGQGWYRPEDIGGVRGRWAGSELTTTLRVALDLGGIYQVRFRALAYPQGQRVRLMMGSATTDEILLGQSWAEHTVTLSLGEIQDLQILTLELVHATMRTPFEMTGGTSNDRRGLTAAYDWLCLTPQ